jgi:hypothetical protein
VILRKGETMVDINRKDADQILHQSDYQPRELARILGTTQAFLFNEVWRGNLRAVKVGNDIVRFTRRDVLDWLTTRSPGAATTSDIHSA